MLLFICVKCWLFIDMNGVCVEYLLIIMACKWTHNSCTPEQKLKALKCLDVGESITRLAAEFRVGKATISNWKKVCQNRKIFYCNK